MQHSWLRADPIFPLGAWTRPSPPAGDGKHWETCRKLMMNYDDSMANDWKQEIQNQLLVSTLLSAVTTAFVVETQKELYEDPTKTSALALIQILKQLNQSAGVTTTLEPFSSPSSSNTIINVFWFTSLALSLSTATIGLLCLQWIQEYQKDPNHLPHEKYFDFRQFRSVGFQNLGAKTIISLLPVLLILSLVTFFGGLLAFLATISWTVSIPVYVIILTTFALLLYTTFAPAIRALLVCLKNRDDASGYRSSLVLSANAYVNPPFRSLQSWVVLKSVLLAASFINRKNEAAKSLLKCRDWMRVDVQWCSWTPRLTQESLRPLLDLFADSNDNLTAIYLTIMDVGSKKQLSTYERRSHLGAYPTTQSKTFTLLVTLLSSQQRGSQNLHRFQSSRPSDSDFWDEHVLETFIDATNQAQTDEELGYIVEKGPSIVTLSIRRTKRLDLLLQLHHSLLIRSNPPEPRFPCTILYLWTTFGQILIHPDFPSDDIPTIIYDTMDLMGSLHPIELARRWMFGFEDIIVKDLPRARKAIYYLSRLSIWEPVFCHGNPEEVPLTVKLAEAEDVLQPDFLPPADWPPVQRQSRRPTNSTSKSGPLSLVTEDALQALRSEPVPHLPSESPTQVVPVESRTNPNLSLDRRTGVEDILEGRQGTLGRVPLRHMSLATDIEPSSKVVDMGDSDGTLLPRHRRPTSGRGPGV